MVKKNKLSRMPSALVARKRRRARREILETTQAILKENGPDGLTLASVAGQLGMTKQAIYHYFPSKEALVRALVTELLDEEIEFLVAAAESAERGSRVPGTVIRAFYEFYIERLDAFRLVYCQPQLLSGSAATIDEPTLTQQVHPRTRRLFDVLESRLAGRTRSAAKRRQKRQLAFTAWTSVLGLMTMISLADATDDPLAQPHNALLDMLCDVFDQAAG